MNQFETLELKGGIWHGVLQSDTEPGRIILVHYGERIAQARVTPNGENSWRVAVAIPSERLSDGLQSFLLLQDDGKDLDAPQPGALHLASMSLSAGEALDYDLLQELTLLRNEVDLLKKELRRLAATL